MVALKLSCHLLLRLACRARGQQDEKSKAFHENHPLLSCNSEIECSAVAMCAPQKKRSTIATSTAAVAPWAVWTLR